MTNTIILAMLTKLDTIMYRDFHGLNAGLDEDEKMKLANTAETLVNDINKALDSENEQSKADFITLGLRERFEVGGYNEARLVISNGKAEIKTKLSEYVHNFSNALRDDVITEMKDILESELLSKKRKTKDFSKIISELVGFEVTINNYDINYLKYALIGTNKKGFKLAKKDVNKALSRMLHIHCTHGTYEVKGLGK